MEIRPWARLLMLPNRQSAAVKRCWSFAKARVRAGSGIALAVVTGARAQQALTPEWVAGETGSRLAAVPRTAWRRDGTLWIYDDRDPGRLSAFELLNPSTGVRRTWGIPGARSRRLTPRSLLASR